MFEQLSSKKQTVWQRTKELASSPTTQVVLGGVGYVAGAAVLGAAGLVASAKAVGAVTVVVATTAFVVGGIVMVHGMTRSGVSRWKVEVDVPTPEPEATVAAAY